MPYYLIFLSITNLNLSKTTRLECAPLLLKNNSFAPSRPPDLHLFLISAVSSSLMPESVGIYDVSDTLCVPWRGRECVRKGLVKFTSVD